MSRYVPRRAPYWIRKRVEFMLGGRGFVAIEADFRDAKPTERDPWGHRVERELYVVDDDGLEMFVGYIGSLHLADQRLARLQSRAAKKLDEAKTREEFIGL